MEERLKKIADWITCGMPYWLRGMLASFGMVIAAVIGLASLAGALAIPWLFLSLMASTVVMTNGYCMVVEPMPISYVLWTSIFCI
jgi:hypothetical protein